MTPTKKKYFPGTWPTSQNRYCLIKWLPFVFFFFGGGPHGARGFGGATATLPAVPSRCFSWENRKFKKPYIKLVRDFFLWDFGRWEGWEIILGWIPTNCRGIWSYQNLKNMIVLPFFSISPWGPTKTTCLFITPNNKFQDHPHQNRIEKLVPMKELSKQIPENY